MKTLFLIFLTFFINFTPEDVKCNSIEKCLNLMMNEKKVLTFLHSDIKERVPFRFLNLMNCESNRYNLFQIIPVEKFEDDSIRIKNGFDVHILNFKETQNEAELNLFYPIEGGGIDCKFEKHEGKYFISKMSFYEI
ncbi:hypothetical protein KIH23_13595 [Flavobacterium sp. CYK-55]|uniref:hypothetical protein n=1 Tax=Flavobacterium sp. CYK-55 TaxID=2835529 RepID=UPI001BCF831D|nr:hypothetical protein [Flavobacterium sp. CYK-55]MBS7788333.1 hypothetical protein [Flavobacterium sp. CYK-55]